MILCLTIIALFASTTIYNVNYTLFYQSVLSMNYIKSGRALWTPSSSAAIEYPTDPLELVKDCSGLTDQCGCTATLTVNVSVSLSRCVSRHFSNPILPYRSYSETRLFAGGHAPSGRKTVS